MRLFEKKVSQLGIQISHDDYSKSVQISCLACPCNHMHFNELVWPIFLCFSPPRHLILFISSLSHLIQWRRISICIPSHTMEESTDSPAVGLGDMAGPCQMWTTVLQRSFFCFFCFFCNANLSFFCRCFLRICTDHYVDNERSLLSSSSVHGEFNHRTGTGQI